MSSRCRVPLEIPVKWRRLDLPLLGLKLIDKAEIHCIFEGELELGAGDHFIFQYLAKYDFVRKVLENSQAIYRQE